jgi:predicted transcriptional regulator
LQRVNTIWEIRNEEWISVRSFSEIAELGEKHFKNLYKELYQANIEEILKLTTFFPSFITEEIC